MILFFHIICLLARYIYFNFSKTFLESEHSSEESIERSSTSPSSKQEFSKRKIEYKKNPVYEDGLLRFFPPVFVQRYETVAFTLEDPELEGKIKKVVDFGCGELGFFMYLKNIENITEILEVDIDSSILERYSFKAAPLTVDYLMGKREKPLDVYILAGNVADYDDHLLGCDAVVAIELIEHMNEEDFKRLPYNIFHKIKPKIAIFTTPNADFNSVLPNCTKMRHKDHKFEWTRKEFFKWTQDVLKEYPEYYVRFFGIGAGPEGTENLGCCTQMAVFKRSDDAELFLTSRDDSKNIQNYKLIQHYEFPAYVDTRTTEEKIIHEIQYHASYFKDSDKFSNFETNQSEIPLNVLIEYVSDLCSNEEELMKILNSNGLTLKYKDKAWFLILSDTDSISSDCNISSENLLSEEITMNEASDLNFIDKWSDEEHLNAGKLGHFQSRSSLKEFSLNTSNLKRSHQTGNNECVFTPNHRNSTASQTLGRLFQGDNSFQKTPRHDVRNQENAKSISSRIPYKTNEKETEFAHSKKSSLFHVCRPFNIISKSSSLDSCLENIKFKSSESYLMHESSSSFNQFSCISTLKRKHINHSDSSLISSSFDKAGDSGYPFSFSSPNDDLTPEQADELFTESEMSESTSLSRYDIEVEVDEPRHEPHHDVFIENIPVENGDVANNNRDREGNNVEGLLGQRFLNEVPVVRDPNDNFFFPEIDEFPPWLLNLGQLVPRPVYLPL